MASELVIVDYGSGNLRSCAKAFERVAQEAGSRTRITVTDDPDRVARAERIVVPGVGAFGDCRRGLLAVDGMAQALEEAASANARPILGICVGMQLMASRGLEHGTHEGFGWVPGDVVALNAALPDLRTPHMGWNTLDSIAADHPVLRDLPGEDGQRHAYFVHSYHFEARNPAHVLARSSYGPDFAAVVGRDTLVGTQFHPEKSQAVGLAILRNFLEWRP